jgi:hypothetical protein
MTANPGDKSLKEDAARPPALGARITVALVRKASEDLQLLQDRTGLSKTDIVNRAITLYEFVNTELEAGNDVVLRNRQTGETQVIHLL